MDERELEMLLGGSINKIKRDFQHWLIHENKFSSDLLNPQETIEISARKGNRFTCGAECNRFEYELCMYLRIKAYLKYKGYDVRKTANESNYRIVISMETKKYIISTEKNRGLMSLYVDTHEHGDEVCKLLNNYEIFNSLFFD